MILFLPLAIFGLVGMFGAAATIPALIFRDRSKMGAVPFGLFCSGLGCWSLFFLIAKLGEVLNLGGGYLLVLFFGPPCGSIFIGFQGTRIWNRWFGKSE